MTVLDFLKSHTEILQMSHIKFKQWKWMSASFQMRC